MTKNTKAVLDEPVSYEELYAAHYGEVLRLCRLLLADRHEAEEVTQEVFLKVLREYQTPNRNRTIVWKPWLIRVSVNACRDRQRSGWWKWWRSKNESYQEADHLSPNMTPEEMVLSKETQSRIWHAFRKLSKRQQEVFALRRIEGLSTEEVAEMLGVATGSVKRHLFRAVRQLRCVLGDCL